MYHITGIIASSGLLALVWLNHWGQNQYNSDCPQTSDCLHWASTHLQVCVSSPEPSELLIPTNLNSSTIGERLSAQEDRTLLLVIALTCSHCRESLPPQLSFLSINKTWVYLVSKETLNFSNILCPQWPESPSQRPFLKFCSSFKPQVKCCFLFGTCFVSPSWN